MNDTPRTSSEILAGCPEIECGKLELELNEVKAELRQAIIDKENAIIDRHRQYKIAIDFENKLAQAEETADHFKGRAEEFYKKLAEYERQISDGELIPIDIAIQWATEVPFGSKTLQQFAKESAKK